MSNHSDFWLKVNNYDWDWEDEDDVTIQEKNDLNTDVDNKECISDNTTRVIRLSAARRAVANYVSILTNQIVPVVFNDHAVNCTDGKVVYISSDITKKDKFDVTIGLALHEGSHIKYSDFELFKTVWMNVPREIYSYSENLNISKTDVGRICQSILNYVEDRYIDYTVYYNAPGYRGYYDALYDEYFNNNVISDALTSNLYRTLSTESYMFRIINLTNPATSLKALPGLYYIARELDLSNIKRLTTPIDRLNVAYNISAIMFKNINEHRTADTSSQKTDESSADSGVGVQSDNSNPSKTDVDVQNVLGGTESSVTSDSKDVTDDIGKDDNISASKKRRIDKSFEKQKDFLSGKLKKKKVTVSDKKLLDILEKSQIDLVPVAHEELKSQGIIGNVDCIFVKNMTKELIFSDEFPMGVKDKKPRYDYQMSVDEGIVLGTKMGRRLQIRNEINIDKFTRRNVGKIDKRLMHELGFDTDTNIFYNTQTTKYKKVNFHISVDASASMQGKKWNRTIKLCVALTKAISMINNVDVAVSFRTTSTSGNNPYIAIAYDSRVDKFTKIKNLFAYLTPVNTTPEGLCFEALMRYLPKVSTDTNNYFINISDGQPRFVCNSIGVGSFNYHGEESFNHTRKQVNKIRKNGYNVISYYVSDNEWEFGISHRDNFKKMYGKDANFINIENLNQIVSTVNTKMMDAIDG